MNKTLGLYWQMIEILLLAIIKIALNLHIALSLKKGKIRFFECILNVEKK